MQAVMLLNISIILLVIVGVSCDTKPMYKYRYATEDIMETAASSYPLHGYQVVESGYYPVSQFSGKIFRLFINKNKSDSNFFN